MMSAVSRLDDALARHASRWPHRLAMKDRTTSLTWLDLSRAIASIEAVLPEGRIGLFGENSCAWAITYLAALKSGRTVVPIPTFFSRQQKAHIARAASLSAIAATAEVPNDFDFDLPVIDVRDAALDRGAKSPTPLSLERHADQDAVVVFTSGSTGAPKGVRLTIESMIATAESLKMALLVSEQDTYLSLLPLPLLLEQICAILVPVLAGATTEFDAELSGAVISGESFDIAGAIARAKPSILVMVPDLLARLVAAIGVRAGQGDLSCLRFVAVGGAAVGTSAIVEARALGLPVYEGYGLTECASVVALNTPLFDAPGSAGAPLPGHSVKIVDDEICVMGPSVMAGYLGEGDLPEPVWRTGDLGELRSDGALVVFGRKDNLVVLKTGRNISPEWVEKAIRATGLVRNAVVVPTDDHAGLAAILIADWPANDTQSSIAAIDLALRNELPSYAIPCEFSILSSERCSALGLFRMGKPDRRLARNTISQTMKMTQKEPIMKPYDRLISATRAERDAFMRLPLVEQSIAQGASREIYLAFLCEAYHHVKHTFPLLALSASLTKDAKMRAALAEYMKEEFGHEEWILDDIRRMGGDPARVAASKPRFPCRVMISHVYHSVQWESPYAVLGMVHVLEGLSVLLADKVAGALKLRFGTTTDDGFSYLKTHGSLDIEHTEMFQRLLNSLTDPSVVDIVIDHTQMMYRLYGAIFEDLGALELHKAA